MHKHLLILTFIVSFCTSISAQEYITESISLNIEKIIEDTIMQRYKPAVARCDSLITTHPEHPVGYFFLAATLQSKMMDYEVYDELDAFFKFTEKAKKLSEKDIKTYPESSWPYFFYGGALGYEAMVRGRHNELFRAFRDGLKSINLLQKAIELDSTNYDVYLGIGTYKYYRSQVGKYFKWLPFVDDERELGKQMIRSAIEKGRFSHAAAINGLFWILVKENNYEEAHKLINQAVTEYPGSRFFMWGKAQIARRMEKWQEAKQTYLKILESYKIEGTMSPFNEMQCHTSMAEIALREGDHEEAQRLAQNALDYNIDDYLKDRAKPVQNRAKDILNEIEKQH